MCLTKWQYLQLAAIMLLRANILNWISFMLLGFILFTLARFFMSFDFPCISIFQCSLDPTTIVHRFVHIRISLWAWNFFLFLFLHTFCINIWFTRNGLHGISPSLYWFWYLSVDSDLVELYIIVFTNSTLPLLPETIRDV